VRAASRWLVRLVAIPLNTWTVQDKAQPVDY
jgi:hypothetical protein